MVYAISTKVNMKSQGLFAIVLAVVGIAVVGVFLSGMFSNPGTGSSVIPANANPKTVTVDITSSGFDPSSVTINSGDTIKFVNLDSSAHWPASNPHPTHTDYPGFAALHDLQQGESYSFTFTRIGTWGYHDHLNPFVGGTISVQ